MTSIIGSPSRYVQGKGELSKLYQHVSNFGKKMFIIVSESGKRRVEGGIAQSLAGTEGSAAYFIFGGECSKSEIERIRKAYHTAGCELIVGIGGGKILDAAKASAYYEGCPVVIAPTAASTDAPCSALSVLYTDDGVFEEYLFLPSSPNMVLVDTAVISKAPARLLISGMGDALATYFEARACAASEAQNCVGGQTTLAAQALAKLCYETLLANGIQAAAAVKAGACTKAVENIIEANTYLSGIGFESGGLAGAHAIHNGLTALAETHAYYHGEKVAFGTLVQLVLENAPLEEMGEVVEFCRELGLPTTLAALGVKEINRERLMEVATLACAEGDTLHNMPFTVTPDSVCDAILAANALGDLL